VIFMLVVLGVPPGVFEKIVDLEILGPELFRNGDDVSALFILFLKKRLPQRQKRGELQRVSPDPARQIQGLA